MLAEGLALSVFDDVYHVGPLLGQGGEGAVFTVVDATGSPRFALKWYHPKTAHGHRWENLRALADIGPPNDDFLWPLAVIGADDGSQFGYVMHLRPESYIGMSKVLTGDAERIDRSLARACADLARCFYALHARGLCYRDINFGNVFIEPRGGTVLVCDNDNVGIDGTSRASVAGTPKFMAPEIVLGQAMPSAATDRFSLAVLLFYILIVAHPLEGRLTERVLEDDESHRRFHGSEPLFCLHPNDDANRPDPEFQPHVMPYWQNLPAFIRDLFTHSFTLGLGDPNVRIRDSEWFRAMTRLADSVYSCPGCAEDRFLDVAAPSLACPWCESSSAEQLLALSPQAPGSYPIVAQAGAVVGRHHFTLDLREDESFATVEANPDQPDVLGVRNVSSEPWTLHPPGADPITVVPQRVARLLPGAQLRGTDWAVDVKKLVLRR